MSKFMFVMLIVVCVLAGLFMWGLGESSKECEEKYGNDYSLRVDGSYMRCVNDRGEVREL